MASKTIIFDFDGTIANTLDELIKIYNRIAPNYKCPTINKEQIKLLKSKNHHELLKDFGLTNYKLPIILLHIKKELQHSITKIQPVSGIVEELHKIYSSNHSLGIISSNSVQNVKTFLNLHNLTHLFKFIYSGSNIFGKDKIINQAVKNYNLNINNIIYVGDETRDVEASKKVNIPIIAVTWGFSSKKILSTHSPTVIIDHPSKLLKNIKSIHAKTLNDKLSAI